MSETINKRGPFSLPERAVVALLFVIMASFFPYFEEIHSANELSRLYLANAIVNEGTIQIDQPLARLGNIHDKAHRDGHFYSDKAPGTSFWAVPAVWVYMHLSDSPTLEGELRLLRLWCVTIPTAFLLLGLLGLLKEYIACVRLRLLLITGYALGTLAGVYGILLFGHQLSAVLVFATFLVARKADDGVTWKRGLLVGVLAASAVCVEYQNVLFLLPIAAMYIVKTRKAYKRALPAALLGALPLAIVLGAYHNAAFGSPWTTGYSYIASHFKDVHAQGVMGISWPTWDHFVLNTFSARRGLFFFSPFLIFGVFGLYMLRKYRTEAIVTTVMVLGYLWFVSGMIYPIGGWAVCQRHLTPMVPWLILPAGLMVQRLDWSRPVFLGLMAISIVFIGVSMVTWPHFDERFYNPVFSIAIPLFHDGWVVPSMFSGLGISTRTLVYVLAMGLAGVMVWDLVAWSRHAPIIGWSRRPSWGRAVALVAVIGLFAATPIIEFSKAKRFYPDEAKKPALSHHVRWIKTKAHEPDPATQRQKVP